VGQLELCECLTKVLESSVQASVHKQFLTYFDNVM